MSIHKQEKNNLLTYLVLLAIAFAGILIGQDMESEGRFIRVWRYADLAWMLVGVPFLFLQAKAGLPDLWEPAVSTQKRWLIPLMIGAIFGILDILVIKVIMHPEPYTELPPFLQPFPYSIFLYTSGAFEIEVFYRLIPLTILLLMGKYFRQGNYYNAFMWAAIILTSLREPIEQFPTGSVRFIMYAFSSGFLMNFLQAQVFVRYGFIASLAIRLGHYMFWHILLGVYVEVVEL